MPISYRYRCQYLLIADLSLSANLATVEIYGCVAGMSRRVRRVVHMVVSSLVSSLCGCASTLDYGKEIQGVAVFYHYR